MQRRSQSVQRAKVRVRLAALDKLPAIGALEECRVRPRQRTRRPREVPRRRRRGGLGREGGRLLRGGGGRGGGGFDGAVLLQDGDEGLDGRGVADRVERLVPGEVKGRKDGRALRTTAEAKKTIVDLRLK